MTNHVDERHKTEITTPSDTEIRIERSFDAPRGIVWEAYTEAESMAEWLGPRTQTMTVEEMDVRPGGSYRYTSHAPDRDDFVFFGDFLEVEPVALLVATFGFEGLECSPKVDRSEFEELNGGRTRLVITSTFETKEQRDAMLSSGMERGVTDGFDKLDDLLNRMQSA